MKAPTRLVAVKISLLIVLLVAIAAIGAYIPKANNIPNWGPNLTVTCTNANHDCRWNLVQKDVLHQAIPWIVLGALASLGTLAVVIKQFNVKPLDLAIVLLAIVLIATELFLYHDVNRKIVGCDGGPIGQTTIQLGPPLITQEQCIGVSD